MLNFELLLLELCPHEISHFIKCLELLLSTELLLGTTGVKEGASPAREPLPEAALVCKGYLPPSPFVMVNLLCQLDWAMQCPG